MCQSFRTIAAALADACVAADTDTDTQMQIQIQRLISQSVSLDKRETAHRKPKTTRGAAKKTLRLRPIDF